MRAEKRKFNNEFWIFITQITVVTLMILLVIFAKFLNGGWFNSLKGFYLKNFNSNTSVSEVTEAEEENTTYLSTRTLKTSSMNLVKDFNNSLKLPLNSFTLSSEFGWRKNPFGEGLEFHKGVDLAAEKGSSIFAACGGTVILSQYSNSYGNYMIIEHSNGFKTLYAHCERLLKGSGDKVSAGEAIALVGSTGRSKGPHLHFEIIINDENINPKWYLDI